MLNRRQLFQVLAGGGLLARARAELKKIKITRVRLWESPISRPIFNQSFHVVTVETDQGITGIGEGGSRDSIEQCAAMLIGQEASRIGHLWQYVYRGHFYPPGREKLHALGALDLALWDIKGKALGLPVWKLLGGGFRDRVRCYASVLFGSTPDQTREIGARLAGRGFSAVKFGWDPMGRDAATDIALVREARRGVGAGVDLMIDAGLVWDAKTAIQRARAFSAYDIFWLEEPLLPDDYEGYRRLTEATDVRIAAGEEESNRQSFLDLMDRGRIDVVQVDLTRCGGFTEAMKIASLAEDRGLPVVNHGFTTYINIAAALHFLAAIPNAFILEYVAEEETRLRDEITRQPVAAVDGWVRVPDAPGLGVELNEEAVARYRTG